MIEQIKTESTRLSGKERTLTLAKALMGFYVDIFPDWNFPQHLVPVAYGLCDERIKQLQVHIGPGAGKSQLLSICYPTFAIGRNPNEAILGISGAEALVQKFQKASMSIIENNKAFKEYFPDVRPNKKVGWSTDTGANVTGRTLDIPDPSFWGAGINSATVVGAHASIIILDDIHNAENSATDAQCKKVLDLYSSTIVGRAQSTGARFILAGRRWHVNDLYGELQKDLDWVTVIIPAERQGEERLYAEVIVPSDLECIFSEIGEYIKTDTNGMRRYKVYYGVDVKKQGFFWPEMESKRKEYFSVKRLTPAIAESVYQCRPGRREGGIFNKNDFRYTDEPVTARWITSQGGVIFQAWDTATGETEKSDYSVCITGGFVPCQEYHNNEDPLLYGECDPHIDVYIMDVFRENIKFGDLMMAVRAQYAKWNPIEVVMERKSSGIQIIQSLQQIAIPIEGVNPGQEGKRARAVNGVGTGTGSVQGWFKLGRVIFPRKADWLTPLEDELKDFTGDGSGKDDQADAIVYLIVSAIKRGSGMVMLPSGFVEGNGEELGLDDVSGGFDMLSNLLTMNIYDPSDGSCNKCVHYNKGICQLKKRKMNLLDSCQMFQSKDESIYII